MLLISANSHYQEDELNQKYQDELENWLIKEKDYQIKLVKHTHPTPDIIENLLNESMDINREFKFNNYDNIRLSIVEASLKKIRRAEQELDQAERLFRSMMNQNKWIIAIEFGFAQAKLERLLMEMELHFLSRTSLDENQFLKMNGHLEQNILEGMRRIHSILDLIPYNPSKWGVCEQNLNTFKEDLIKKLQFPPDTNIHTSSTHNGQTAPLTYPFLVEMERMVYGLWLQFFVVGAFYSGLLNGLYEQTKSANKPDNEQFINAIKGEYAKGKDADDYKSRWIYWCNSVRFQSLARNVKISFTTGFSNKNDDAEYPAIIEENLSSLRSVVISVMQNESTSAHINMLWNARRPDKKESTNN